MAFNVRIPSPRVSPQGGPLSEISDPLLRKQIESYSIPKEEELTPAERVPSIEELLESRANPLAPLATPEWAVPLKNRSELYPGEIPLKGPYNVDEGAYDMEMVPKSVVQSGEVPFQNPENPEGVAIDTPETLDAVLGNPEFPPSFGQRIEGVNPETWDAYSEEEQEPRRADWAYQAATEQGNRFAIQQAANDYSSPDPEVREKAVLALAQLVQSSEEGRLDSDQASPWVKKKIPLAEDRMLHSDPQKLQRHIVATAAAIQPSLDAVMDFARAALFDFETATMKTHDLKDPLSPKVTTVGVQALIDKARREKLPDGTYLGQDKQLSRQIQFTMGNAGLSAIAQSVGGRGKKKTGEDGEVNWMDDTSYIGDFINSVRHAAINGFKKLGLDPEDLNVDALSSGLVFDFINKGLLSSVTDPNTGQPILVPSSSIRNVARMLERVTDAMTGNSTRGRTGITPQPPEGLLGRGSGLVKKAILEGLPKGIVRRAAEAVKVILGSVGLVFPKANLARKTRELDLIMGKDFLVIDPLDGQTPIYSNHPMAKRLGLHKGAYDVARLNVMYPRNYDATNPEHVAAYEALKDDRARDVMTMKFEEVKMVMQAVNESGASGKVRFNRFTHALNNQRFYVNTFDGDYMGSKNIVREVMTFAKKDYAQGHDLFNERAVVALQLKAKNLWSGDSREDSWGPRVLNRLKNEVSKDQLAALGAMRNAVVYYHTAIEPITIDGYPADITQADPATIIGMYTPAIGAKLAELGAALKDYMETGDPKNPEAKKGNQEMLDLWAATEKGSSLGVLNLWDDFFNLQAASSPQSKAIPLTHHSIADGRQSGILLQALMYGISDPLNMRIIGALAAPGMLMPDLREQVFSNMIEKLNDALSEEQAERLSGLLSFFNKLVDSSSQNAVAKNWIKKPLMQAAYGKNVAMFFTELMETLQSDEKTLALFSEDVAPAYGGDINLAVKDLSDALGNALREYIDSKSNKVMENFGNLMGVYNVGVFVPGASGDTLVLTPTANAPINSKAERQSRSQREETSAFSGKNIRTKSNEFEKLRTEMEDGSIASVALRRPQNFPAAGRKKVFKDTANQKRLEIIEPFGSALRRQLAVLLTQALDGDGIKFTTLITNNEPNLSRAERDRRGPRPIYWVHDSSVSTPGQSLLYDHVYNNITLTALGKSMLNLGDNLTKAEEYGRAEASRQIRALRAADNLVGIGDEGEFPALSDLFESAEAKMLDPEFRRRWRDEAEYEAERKRVLEILKLARQQGWRSPEDFRDPNSRVVDPKWERWKKEMAVSPDQALALMTLAKTLLHMNPLDKASDLWTPWKKAHKERVRNSIQAFKRLSARGGKAHMTPQGGRSTSEAPAPGTEGTTLADLLAVRNIREDAKKEIDKLSALINKDVDQELGRDAAGLEAGRRRALEDFEFRKNTPKYAQSVAARDQYVHEEVAKKLIKTIRRTLPQEKRLPESEELIRAISEYVKTHAPSETNKERFQLRRLITELLNQGFIIDATEEERKLQQRRKNQFWQAVHERGRQEKQGALEESLMGTEYETADYDERNEQFFKNLSADQEEPDF